MGARKYRDIEVRGVVYPTAQAAAAALGVREITVHKALQSGRLDTLGTGAAHPTPMRVRIAGRVFPDARAAAAHFGVTVGAVRNAILEGDPDRIARKRRGRRGVNAKPVTIGPVTFPSMRAADEALGYSHGIVSRILRRGGPRAREALVGRAMAWARKAA